jgi:hypothetical protein
MRKIIDYSQQSLKWVQPKMFENKYELHASDELVATLTFRGSGGTFAAAESGDGSWTFKRVGFWKNKATVWTRESESELAVFRNNTWTGGGMLEFANGKKYNATTNFWMTNYEFQKDTGEPLVRFKYGGIFHLSSEVEILPEARGSSELPVIIMFGWYLAVMLYMDSSEAAVVAAT